MTTMVLDEPQHIHALREANRLRLGGARVKERVAALSRADAFREVADLIEDPPDDFTRHVRLNCLVRAIPYMGRKTTMQFLDSFFLDRSQQAVHLGHLRLRDRKTLAWSLRRMATNAEKWDRKRGRKT
jgi:hypothetical protein